MTRLKFPFVLTALFVCGTLSANETATPAAAGDPLSETIQENVKEKLTIQKVIPAIELNVKDTVESGTARTDTVLAGQKPIPSEEDFQHYAMLNSNQVLRPWNPLIPEPPLVTFYPGLSKVASKTWEFKVSDQAGDVVKTIKGKGVPPSSIEWNGLNERGEFITVGTLYSYQFITYDEHGNAHTFPGEPFQLDALLYRQKGKLFVEFSSEKLFDKDGAIMKPGMKGLWERAIDVVRENSDSPITVEVFSDSVQSPLAEERRRVAVTSISNSTNIPAVDIRHKVEKINERGSILRLVMNKK